MENAYGIGVKNRYELFYNEDVDPFEILRKQEEEKERRKTDKAQKDKSKGSKGGKQFTPGPLKKSPKEVIPSNPPKPIETSEVPNKPRNRTFGDRNTKIPSGSFDEPKENEERKNFRNREDQHFSSEVSSTFTVRNTVYKRGNQERDRGDGEFRRGRGGFRGRGRGRGRGGFTNFDGRRREFDRQSGSDKTGIRHMDKRDGGGAHNWGDIKDDFDNNRSMDKRDVSGSNNWGDIKDEFDGNRQIDKREGSNSWGDIKDDFEIQQSNQSEEPAEKIGDETVTENTESKENEPTVEGEPTEEGPREMTLDEWKREQESKRCVPKYNLRKPGEGEDNTQWKKLYMLKKKAKEEDDDEEEEEEDADDEEFGRRGRQRQLVDIQINFSDSRRGRGRGRGGRGTGPRGGGGGGSGSSSGVGGGVSSGESGTGGIGNRGGSGGSGSSGGGRGMGRGTPKINKSPQQSAPRVDDWNDFPSLVTA